MTTVDITPSPRILRTLGEIPFAPWQCIAELVDNSIDALSSSDQADRRIAVGWSEEAVAPDSRTIEIIDNGPGMSLETLTNAASAGWSGNDPIGNLGLFGMGFNIATARLGERTRISSATADAAEWIGIEIDFASLTESKGFKAPVFREPKRTPGEHWTIIEVSKLKTGPFAELNAQQPRIRRQLETVYSPLLRDAGISVELQGRALHARPHCIWGENRMIMRGGDAVPAVFRIDEDLGTALFDLKRNAYLTPYEQDVAQAEHPDGLPSHIVERRKRLHGWLGIQRYADPDDFGIDFVRNGRKILMGDKSLFSFVSPVSGRSVLEYPVELGSTVGGRIVGELEVDYLIPTYQKNDFDRSDLSWHETVEALRGVGPILPKNRKIAGFPDANPAPLSVLANAYRRIEPGTKCLSIESSIAKQWAARFSSGDPDYADDTRWWEAALDADRRKRGEDAVVPAAGDASDDVDAYEPVETGPQGAEPASGGDDADTLVPDTPRDDAVARARKIEGLSRDYRIAPSALPMTSSVYELREGSLTRDGMSVPALVFQTGARCEVVVDPTHHLVRTASLTVRDIAALYLSERLKLRDNLRDTATTFLQLCDSSFPDDRMDQERLRERANSVFSRVRDALVEHLADQYEEVFDCVSESSGEVEQLLQSIMGEPDLVVAFSSRSADAIAVIYFLPGRTILRLVDRFSSRLMDGRCFRTLYASLSIPGDELASQRLRTESKERLLGLLKDATWMLGETNLLATKDDLLRSAYSLALLEHEIL